MDIFNRYQQFLFLILCSCLYGCASTTHANLIGKTAEKTTWSVYGAVTSSKETNEKEAEEWKQNLCKGEDGRITAFERGPFINVVDWATWNAIIECYRKP